MARRNRKPTDHLAAPLPLDQITEDIFRRYEKVRVSGVTNMFDGDTVCLLGHLTWAEYAGVMDHYKALMAKFPGVRR